MQRCFRRRQVSLYFERGANRSDGHGCGLYSQPAGKEYELYLAARGKKEFRCAENLAG